MPNPMQRKNDAAPAGDVERNQSAPGEAGPFDQGRHSDKEAPAAMGGPTSAGTGISARPESRPETAPDQPGAAARPAPAARSGGADPADDDQGLSLFSDEDARRFQAMWRDAQGDFVDDPRKAVGTADALVEDVLRTLNAKFAEHKRTLEDQWSTQGEADTEALRRAMRGYRTFFRQLLQTTD